MQDRTRSQHAVLLLPSPAKIRLIGGCLALPAEISLYEEPPPSTFSKTFRTELCSQRTTEASAATVRLLLPESGPEDLRPWIANPEGYGVHIGQDGILIWASTGAGHFYGLITLCQLIRQYGRRIPCMVIGDAPILARRGVQLSFPQGHTCYRRAYMRHLIPKLALWKINELYRVMADALQQTWGFGYPLAKPNSLRSLPPALDPKTKRRSSVSRKRVSG